MFGKCKLKAEIERLKKENEAHRAFVNDLIRELLNKVYFDQNLSICSKDKLISEYEKVLSDCYIRGPKGRFVKYGKETTPSFKVSEKDIIGDIAGFPKEVLELMLERQYEQTGKINIEVFKDNRISGKPGLGFMWSESKEGYYFWECVIRNKNFDVFFEKYPKKLK